MARRVLYLAAMSERNGELVPLRKHVLFVRALAGLPRVAVGIAAGATLFTMSGCTSGCVGSYGAIPPPQSQHDAMVDHGHRDAEADSEPADARHTQATDGGHEGGGPTMAPALPAAWV